MKSLIIVCWCVASIWAVPLAQQKPPVPIRAASNVGVIGGDVAKDGQFPWQVAVYLDTSNGTYFCGGALVDPKWVLTAGHCVYHATVFTLHLGANSLVTADPNRVTVGASHSVVHPDYKPDGIDHDIGLIRIDTAYTPNDHIKVIPLASSALGSDVAVTVSGWGATGDWDGVVNDLNFVGIKTISNDDCKSTYGEAITDGMVCTVGDYNQGTCPGDSGSPLVTVDADGNAVHVGAASWISTAGCKTNHPSGFTRTAYYNDWIKSVIAG